MPLKKSRNRSKGIGKYFLVLVVITGAIIFPPVNQFIHNATASDQLKTTPSASFQAKAATPSPALSNNIKKFIQSMGDEATAYIGNPNLDHAQEKEKLKGILKKNFDMYTISRFTMGTNWKKLSDPEKKEYRVLFEDMIASVYADKFSNYQGESFQVAEALPMGESDFNVISYILPKSGKKISVNWRVRVKGEEFKIVDVSIENISMAITQRSDFSSAIQRSGGNPSVILDHLRNMAQKRT